MTTPVLVVVADDLTGACDLAGSFRSQAMSVEVSLDIDDAAATYAEREFPSVVVIDANTRSMSGDAAYRRCERVVRFMLTQWPDTSLFLKIDSTLRGPWERLLSGAVAGWRSTATARSRLRVVVCPAVPYQKRRVHNGVVHVDGQAIDSPIQTRLADFHGHPTAHIEVFDASTDSDLDLIATEAFAWVAGADSQSLCWTGAAGLAAAVGRRGKQSDAGGQVSHIDQRTLPCENIVTIVGSFNPVSRAQAAQLSREPHGGALYSVDITDSQTLGPALEAAVGADGLVLTGGTTARLVLDHLGITHLVAVGEIEPGIPWMNAQREGVNVITKAGGFGGDDALVKSVKTLHRDK